VFRRRFRTDVLIAIFLYAAAQLCAQDQAANDDRQLFKTVQALDSELFQAVNHCDMKKVESYWADDAVFLHDKVPPLVGRDAIVTSIRKNLCGKVERELVLGTLEVHRLKDYGAVEIGVHRFLHPYTQDHGVVGEARFIHTWRFKDGVWQISQVISYDHHEAK
jgi:uncharacterized protein (TIGR02246 family)